MLSAEELHQRARQANSVGRHRAARNLLLKALERDPTPATRSVVEGSLGFIEAERGQPEAGFDLITRALSRKPALTDLEVGVLLAQRALVWRMLGHHREALADFQQALPLVSARPDEAGRLHMNRSHLYLQEGRVGHAMADLDTAVRYFGEAGMPLQQAMARHNQGYAAMLTGDLVHALRLMNEASGVLGASSAINRAISDQDRAEVLFTAGLPEEGRQLLVRAAAVLGDKRLRRKQAEAEFTLARSLALTEPATADMLARRAQRRYQRLDSDTLALRCEAVSVATRIELGWDGESAAEELADQLSAIRLDREALHLRIMARKARLQAGRGVAPVPMTPRASLPLRLLIRELNAEVAASGGDIADALGQIRLGLNELAAWQSTFASLDLRTALVGHGERLARRGLDLALTDGRPSVVLRWVERVGTLAVQIQPVRPPRDEVAAAQLAELRGLAQAANAEDPPTARRRAQLLEAIRQRAWSDPATTELIRPVSLARLQEQLRHTEAGLLAPMTGHGSVWSLVITSTRARLLRLGSEDQIRKLLAGLPADLDLAAADLPPQIVASVHDSLRSRMAQLDELIVRPALPFLTTSRVVINPTGLLSGMCWTLMPSLRGRSLTIPRSASSWVAALRRPHEFATTGLAAGPRLPRGSSEVRQAAEHWPGATVLTGDAATADAVGRLAGRVDLLHLAAHGHHVVDNPLFSNLELVDGPWFGYDLDQLPQVPETVILSACEVGATTIRRGDELLGLTTAWLHAGARCVIASPASVSDEVAAAILPDMHAELARGLPPADALASATAKHPELLSTFQCYGAGW